MKAIFPGSFNPFTIGHLDIVARALKVVDEVVVAIGINLKKQDSEDADRNLSHIRELFADCPRVSVIAYSGLTVDVARKYGARLIIRGFRNGTDAEYERNLAVTNLMITSPENDPDMFASGDPSDSEIDTWIIPARPHLEVISSSIVNELKRFGRDISQFLPSPADCLKACR